MKKVLFPLLCLILAVWLFYSRHQLFHEKNKKLTQITNNDPFRKVCKKALEDSVSFATFKRDPIYTLFYENTTFEEGQFFLSEIKKEFPQLLQSEVLQSVNRLNEVGGPRLYPFEEIGLCSPSVFRYLDLAGTFQKLFGSLQGMKIIEIGGNGSLCKVLHELFEIEHYIIIDFKESLALTKKHLEALGIMNVEYRTPEECTDLSCDFLISEYVFTESNADLQNKYLKSIFPLAKRGYLTCNFYSKFFIIKPLDKKTLLEKIGALHPQHSLLPEEPRTGKENCVIVWNEER